MGGAIALLLAVGVLAASSAAMMLRYGDPTHELAQKAPRTNPARNSGAFLGELPADSDAHRLTDGASAAPAATRPADPLRDLLASAADPSTPAGTAALRGEPAGLPTPDSLDPAAERLSGFTRGQGASAEEFSLWRLPTTKAGAATDFYRSAAEKAGLRLISRAAGPAPATTRPETETPRLLFADAGGGILIVRVVPQPAGGVKVTLWRRPAE